MLKLPRSLLLFAALIVSLSSIARAQLLTADTIGGGYNTIAGFAPNGVALGDGTALTQTFTNITSINTLTFRFISAVPGAGTTLDVYFSGWDTNDAITNISSGSITVPASGAWTIDGGLSYYDAAIDISAVASSLTAIDTYAFTIVGNAASAAATYVIGGADLGATPFGDGSTFTHSGVTVFGDLTGGGAVASGIGDFAFLANSAGGPDSLLAPVPEASTVAVIFAGAFVSMMVGVRIRQRRQQVALPAQA